MTPDPSWVHRTAHVLNPDATRVVSALFLPGQEQAAGGRSRSSDVLGRVLALSDPEVARELAALTAAFAHRHRDLESTWDRHAGLLEHRLANPDGVSTPRRRLIGASFTQEISIEGAGLANPSMVPHPDQSGLSPGATRFVMTLRAISEGHLSSVELRTGTVDAAGVIHLDPGPQVAVRGEPRTAEYSRAAFAHRLHEDAPGDHVDAEAVADADFVLAALPPSFDNADLAGALGLLHAQRLTRGSTGLTADRFARIASSTYQVEFAADSDLQERVLMPQAPCESRGLEDVRMVRFVGPDGAVEHLGTYTAHDGRAISIQLLRTTDFRTFATAPLSGPGARNKGLALFPRQIDGRYVALSRADRENNAVTTSSDLMHWVHPVRIQEPRRSWEIVQLGNCGPPIETERGWLALTHGVGPMRTYSIGALLLDLEDPTRVIGRLERPLLSPDADERSGYVPNVVYSCGAMRHGQTLVLPYGCSDARARIALVDLDRLLDALHPPRRPRGATPSTSEVS
ncbi:MAG: glycoside hydrolase family 130 protein [Actinomycetales bacterium]|nr:glycoside hydrolase family 130 protein [Actinomycetales bacterium]